jgi:hypothetical protein
MKRRKGKLKVNLILTLVFVFFIVYFIFLFKIKNIVIEPEDFEKDLTPYFKDKSPYQIFSNLKEIMINFPEIKKMEIRSNIFEQKLKVEITTSKIIAQICDQKDCFSLDNYGEIIMPHTKEPVGLKIYSFLPIEKNTLLNPEIKNLLALVFEYANWKPLILKEIKIYSNFDIDVIDNTNREFLFDPAKDTEEQIKKLHIFLTKNFSGKRIDLRIPKKIYFK